MGDPLGGLPARPDPPIVGHVTFNSVQLYWNPVRLRGSDERVCYFVTEADGQLKGQFGSVYSGYDTKVQVKGLDPTTQYRYRMRARSKAGYSDWSPMVAVTTTKRPLGWDDLHKAIVLGDAAGVTRCIDAGVDVEARNVLQLTPLMHAAQRGRTIIAAYLISKGADVNYTSTSGKTSLMMACFAANVDLVRLLLRSEAAVEQLDKAGAPALFAACDGGSEEVIKALLARGGAQAVQERYTNACLTALGRVATVSGRVGCAEVLLEWGADVNAADSEGRTPIMLATIAGHEDMVKFLLEQPATDVGALTKHGKTVWDLAVAMGHKSTVRVLQPYMEKIQSLRSDGQGHHMHHAPKSKTKKRG